MVKQINPMSVDFAALRTLRLVYDHGSFSAAAEALGVNQSAVSYTIDRLRRVFADPLFVRQGAQMVATERCGEIVAQAVELLGGFEQLTARSDFNPVDTAHRFSLACNYYERQVILPDVVRRLRREAPGARLEVINSAARGKEQLVRSQAEMLLGPIRPELQGFFSRKLMSDDYVCVVDARRDFVGDGLNLERYIAAKHVVVNYGGGFQSQYLLNLEAQGLEIDQVVSVPSPASLQFMLPGSDLVATVPRKIAQGFRETVAIIDCPLKATIDLHLVWTARTHHSVKHRWLRDLIADVAQGARGGSLFRG